MLEETYKDLEPVGVYTISNTIGIEIMDIIYGIDDSVVWRIPSSSGYEYGESNIKTEYYDDEDEEGFPVFSIGDISIELGMVASLNKNQRSNYDLSFM